jgi:hypothetical protein
MRFYHRTVVEKLLRVPILSLRCRAYKTYVSAPRLKLDLLDTFFFSL